ncbi:MAG: hypothetical protein K6B40_00490 [Firmicutes bacterium]|nr:hypothetical protein [Bacillota bacterium]
MKKGKIVLLSIVGLLFFALITWGTLVINDYNRVFAKYRKPIYTQVIEQSADGNSGVYQGLGYTIHLSGRFRPKSDPEQVTVIDGKGVVLNPYPDVLAADMYLFGHLLRTMEREDPYADLPDGKLQIEDLQGENAQE